MKTFINAIIACTLIMAPSALMATVVTGKVVGMSSRAETAGEKPYFCRANVERSTSPGIANVNLETITIKTPAEKTQPGNATWALTNERDRYTRMAMCDLLLNAVGMDEVTINTMSGIFADDEVGVLSIQTPDFTSQNPTLITPDMCSQNSGLCVATGVVKAVSIGHSTIGGDDDFVCGGYVHTDDGMIAVEVFNDPRDNDAQLMPILGACMTLARGFSSGIPVRIQSYQPYSFPGDVMGKMRLGNQDTADEPVEPYDIKLGRQPLAAPSFIERVRSLFH